MADPLLCGTDSEKLHESSPALSQGCGTIGNLEIGCRGPMILDAEPRILRDIPDQSLRVYGYGLSAPESAVLEDGEGHRFDGETLSDQELWLALRFDLTGARPGAYTLRLVLPGGTSSTYGPVQVSQIQALGVLDGWVPVPGPWQGKVIGHGFRDGLALRLVQGGSAAIPLEILSPIERDTLRVRADLTNAPMGSYGLEISAPWGEAAALAHALFLGTPPVLRVPADYGDIQSALDAAPPCAEVRVDPGSYAQTLTITRPVRLTATGGPRETILEPGGADERVLHVLPEAGALTEITGFTLTHGNPGEGPGGGIWCEAPALIRGNWILQNRADGPGGYGGGIAASDGSRIVENDLIANTTSAVGTDDYWLDAGRPGTGGGIRCRSCLVERNRLLSNSARACGGIVADGILRADTLKDNGNLSPAATLAGALVQGEIDRCAFNNRCGSSVPYVRVEGPSVVEYCTFTDILGDLCYPPAQITLRGSMDFLHNTLAGVSLLACLATRIDSPTPAHLRFRDDLLFEESVVFSNAGECGGYDGGVPTTPIPADSIEIGCNVTATMVRLDSSGHLEDCPSCSIISGWPFFCCMPAEGNECRYDWDLHLLPESPALPANHTAECPDTIGALSPGCRLVPVQLGPHGIAPMDGYVRLSWSLPTDVSVAGFRIEREADGEVASITPEPLPACNPCEFRDDAPPSGTELRYTLIILYQNGESERVFLGQCTTAAGPHPTLSLGAPVPNPVRGRSVIEFSLPAGAGQFSLELQDASGRRVAVLQRGPLSAGPHRIEWEPKSGDGHPLGSGVYFLSLHSREGSLVRRLVLVK